MDSVPEQFTASTGTRLLLVDDNPKLCRMVKEYLEPLGYEVALAYTGTDGLAFGEALASSPVIVKDSSGIERRADVLGAVPTQVNFVAPAGTALGRAEVAIATALGDILVDRVAPGLFSANADGKGVAAAVATHVRSDGAQTSEVVFRCGAAPGSCAAIAIDLGPETEQAYLSLYGTGIRNHSGLDDVAALIGGEPAEVLYAGPQPTFAGLDQVNLRISRSLAGRGEVPVTLVVAGRSANTVTVSLR